jgi:peptidyl-prolyl cis-trans isomerase SurA
MTHPTRLCLAALLAITLAPVWSPAAADGERVRAEIGTRFANGIAAIVENRIITVGDVRRRIQPLLPQILSSVKTQEEFDRTIQQVEDEVIQNLVDDILIVKDFYSDEKRRLPDNYVDNQVKEQIVTEFDNDRAKFLEYLRSIGKTHLEYREIVRDEMIVSYMKQQKRKTETMISPVQIENYYTENRDKFFQDDGVHLRLIRLAPVADESPAVLQQTADRIITELKAGKDFGQLAKQYSQDSRKDREGDWGWIARKDLREELGNAAFALQEGQYSEPIKLERDIFILFVEEKREAGIRPIDDVRDEIERTLVSQQARNAQERWLERLRRDAYVRYFN